MLCKEWEEKMNQRECEFKVHLEECVRENKRVVDNAIQAKQNQIEGYSYCTVL